MHRLTHPFAVRCVGLNHLVTCNPTLKVNAYESSSLWRPCVSCQTEVVHHLSQKRQTTFNNVTIIVAIVIISFWMKKRECKTKTNKTKTTKLGKATKTKEQKHTKSPIKTGLYHHHHCSYKPYSWHMIIYIYIQEAYVLFCTVNDRWVNHVIYFCCLFYYIC